MKLSIDVVPIETPDPGWRVQLIEALDKVISSIPEVDTYTIVIEGCGQIILRREGKKA